MGNVPFLFYSMWEKPMGESACWGLCGLHLTGRRSWEVRWKKTGELDSHPLGVGVVVCELEPVTCWETGWIQACPGMSEGYARDVLSPYLGMKGKKSVRVSVRDNNVWRCRHLLGRKKKTIPASSDVKEVSALCWWNGEKHPGWTSILLSLFSYKLFAPCGPKGGRMFMCDHRNVWHLVRSHSANRVHIGAKSWIISSQNHH